MNPKIVSIFALLALLFVVSSNAQLPKCPANTKLRFAHPCDDRCANVDAPCTFPLKLNCQCEPGYCKTISGQCVLGSRRVQD